MTEPTVGDLVCSTDDYSIKIASVMDAESKQDIFVYGLYNNDTGIREAELRALTTAMVWATKVQADLNEQRQAEEQAAAIVAAMPSVEEDYRGEAVEVTDTPEPPVLTEAELKAALDGD